MRSERRRRKNYVGIEVYEKGMKNKQIKGEGIGRELRRGEIKKSYDEQEGDSEEEE
jgi:hypothetical protein